jgi:MtN3 and saliva related transmembrane protein
MDMTLTALVGFAAALCTTFSLVPQAIKAWRTRSTADVSMGWSSVLTVGTFLWFVYGVMLGDAPLIAANGLSFLLSAAILTAKLRFA